jgi:molybdenum cofactor cytidylyltransferase
MMGVHMTPRIFAIVPAAGRGRRMGAAKQLLTVGDRPMLLATVAPLVAADIAGVCVVLHGELVGQVDLLHLPNVWTARNDDESSEMIDSVRIGVCAWREREAVRDGDGFLVCPGDHPGIARADFEACSAAFRAAPERIIVATRDGVHGHPMIFPAALADGVLSAECDAGLNGLLRVHAQRVMPVECRSPGVTRDVDTPEDYRALGPAE